MRAHPIPKVLLIALVIVIVLSGTAEAAPAQRVSGRPTSSNGASSMHLWLDAASSRRASVTLTVTRPPATSALYFWALQVTLVDASGAVVAGAHLGLQWHPAHPGSAAVNFGGYDANGNELTGSRSSLPSATNNPNTRDFPWKRGSAYRLLISRAPKGWLASITDVATGQATPIRTLFTDAVAVGDAAVFTESFAPCDAGRTEVLWTDLTPSVTATYQSVESGGCSNTAQLAARGGVVQRTNASRAVLYGQRLRYDPAAAAYVSG